MKITKRKITAASDYRTFDGLSLDELEESYPEIYEDFFGRLSEEDLADIDEVYIPKNSNCTHIGMHDNEGYWVWMPLSDLGHLYVPDSAPDEGWVEVDFEELFEYLA